MSEELEELDVRFRMAPTQVWSIRLNANELRAVAYAARAQKTTIGRFIKEATLREASKPSVRWAERPECNEPTTA